MNNLGTLAVLEWLGMRYSREAQDEFAFACPQCGAMAIATPWYYECSDRRCDLRVASSLDMMAWAVDYRYDEARRQVNKRVRRELVQERDVLKLMARRRIMDTWLSYCRKVQTFAVAGLTENVLGSLGTIYPGQESMCVLTVEDVQELSNLAELTGATITGWVREGQPAVAAVVQTTPWAVDHIILMQQSSRVVISWQKQFSGFGGLIGLAHAAQRKFADDPITAVKLQKVLRNGGSMEEVGFWSLHGKVPVESCAFQARKIMMLVDTEDQMVEGSALLRRTKAEDDVRCCSISTAIDAGGVVPLKRSVAWKYARMGFIASTISAKHKVLSPESARIIETSAPPREEIAALAGRYRAAGRIGLASAILAHLDNKIIAEDRNNKVRETSGSYDLETPIGKTPIANFALKFESNLVFRDSSEVYHVARAVCGKDNYEVVLAGAALDSTTSLSESMRFQHATRTDRGSAVPVIIDTVNFRKFVLPHLRREVAGLGSKAGVNCLGWSVDRQVFYFPGMWVDMTGRHIEESFYHPNIPALRSFDSTVDWQPDGQVTLPEVPRNLISMILAQCARYYMRMPIAPICIDQRSPLRQMVMDLAKAMGQRDVLEMNANVRDTLSGSGSRGFPLLTCGYTTQQAMNITNATVIMLTDGGYNQDPGDVFGLAEPMSRLLRHSMVRLVEWLIATGGEDYIEVPSADIHTSYLREGAWLADHVCQLQAWEIAAEETPLDAWLKRCGFDFLSETLRMTGSMRLIAPVDILTEDVIEHLKTLDPSLAVGNVVDASAVALLPAFSRYFGRDMELSVED